MEDICIKSIVTEAGEVYKLVYRIIRGVTECEAGKIPSYGLRVEKYSGRRLEECKEIPNITAKPIEIHRLFMVLSEHTVTPMCLQEVVEDYLCGC